MISARIKSTMNRPIVSSSFCRNSRWSLSGRAFGCCLTLLEQTRADECDPREDHHGAGPRGSAVTDRGEHDIRSDDGGDREQAWDPGVAPAGVAAEREGEDERCEKRESSGEPRFDLVGPRVPRDVVARCIDSAAIEAEDAVEERRDAFRDQYGRAD